MIQLEDAIRIEVPPERVFDQLKTFLTDTSHFRAWHREHERMEWVEGEPLTTGAVCYAEEFVLGRLQRLQMIFTCVEDDFHIEYRPHWPLSLFVPGNAFDLEPIDGGRATLFRAHGKITLSKKLMLALSKKHADRLEAVKRHMHEEALALKAAAEALVH